MSDVDSSAVRERVAREGHRFEFFQAVRLLERAARLDGPGSKDGVGVGRDLPPEREAVRFASVPSLSFAAAPVHSIAPPPSDAQGPTEVRVTFMGLTGPAGALPHHYTSTVIAEERGKERSTRGFFDLFVHRLVSLFYRAWEKYRLPAAYERSKGAEPPAGDSSNDPVPWEGRDPFTSTLMCLVGLGGPGHQGRLSVGSEIFAFYAGQFARRPRTAAGLAAVLSDCFGVHVQIVQFQGAWLRLDQQDRSRLGSSNGDGYCALGRSMVLGGRVWEVQSRFRVRLGPLDYDQFRRFLPGCPGLKELGELTRIYAGPQFDFDVQPVLAAEHVPRSRLGVRGRGRLGGDLWLASAPAEKDFDSRAFGATPM